MAEHLGKWPSKQGPISDIRPSDGCGRDAVLLVVERWYDFPEFGGYLGNVGLDPVEAKPRDFSRDQIDPNARHATPEVLRHDDEDAGRIGQGRRAAEQAERVGADGGCHVEHTSVVPDVESAASQKRGGLVDRQLDRVLDRADRLRVPFADLALAGAAVQELVQPSRMAVPPGQGGEIVCAPLLEGLAAAQTERDPGRWQVAEALVHAPHGLGRQS